MPKTYYQGSEIKRWFVNGVEIRQAFYNSAQIFQKPLPQNVGSFYGGSRSVTSGRVTHTYSGWIDSYTGRTPIGGLIGNQINLFGLGILRGLCIDGGYNGSWTVYSFLLFSESYDALNAIQGLSLNGTYYSAQTAGRQIVASGSVYALSFSVSPPNSLLNLLTSGSAINVTIS